MLLQLRDVCLRSIIMSVYIQLSFSVALIAHQHVRCCKISCAVAAQNFRYLQMERCVWNVKRRGYSRSSDLCTVEKLHLCAKGRRYVIAAVARLPPTFPPNFFQVKVILQLFLQLPLLLLQAPTRATPDGSTPPGKWQSRSLGGRC